MYYLRRRDSAQENAENNRLVEQYKADEAMDEQQTYEEHFKELKRYNDQIEEDKRHYRY